MSRPRALLLVQGLGEAGGAETTVAALASRLPEHGVDVSVWATRYARGPLAEKVRGAGVELHCLDRSGRFDVLPFRSLLAFVREREVDVLHSHNFGSNFWGTAIGHLGGVAVTIAHEHTWAFTGQPLRRLIERRFIGPSVDAYIAGTFADRERMISVTGLPEEKIVVIPEPYVPRDDGVGDLRAELGLPADAPLIGTVAVLRAQKSLDVLLEAFTHVLRAKPDAHLVITGDGPLRPELERAAARLDIASRTHFLGNRRDVGTILAALDLAAISSDYEGTSIFMLECMAYGAPLVSTRVGGPAEVLEDGESVVLVPPRDPVALGRELTTLIADPERPRALAAAAKSLLDEFDLDRIAARHAALYERLLRGQPASEPAALEPTLG